MIPAADISRSPTNCHPERSLVVSKANRQTESKDPYYLGAVPSNHCHSLRNALAVCVLSLTVIFAVPFQSQASRNFPGGKSEITSPDGRYAVLNVDHNEEYRHVLFLKHKTTEKVRQVYEYTRSANIVWSPDSRHFAIDDGAGSDYTETKILSVDEGVPGIDVQKEILDKANYVSGGHHEYFYVAYWIDPRRVVVYHWGYGREDPNGFCDCYVYRLNGPVRNCERQPKDSDRACQQAIP
jgi:hypothetical protein